MADTDNNMDIHLLKRTKISVYVDEALPDILVVTYEYGVKIFKGVLLDSTKRGLPCGVDTLNPAFNVKSTNPDDDTLYSVNQRFAYTCPESNNSKKKPLNISSNRQKHNKMTVRLRPRQVLCSKCKGICNENSENVGRKRKLSETLPAPAKRSANAPVTRSANLEALNRRKLNDVHSAQGELSTALSGNTNKMNIENNPKKPLLTVSNLNTTLRSKSKAKELIEMHSPGDQSDLSNDDAPDNNSEKHFKPSKQKSKKLLKKKKSVCDDYSDNNSEENGERINVNNNSNCELLNPCANTRTIKISYGPQGEGTVLKIPAQIETTEENASDENARLKCKDTDTRAARKALKKAKKEARRKFLLSTSPNCIAANNSPRYSLSGSSPRYSVVDGVTTRLALSNNSPRYLNAAAYDLTVPPRRRKHKMKHKKRHREDRKHEKEEGDTNLTLLEEAAREQCITQKLSINLKRLNSTCTPEDKYENSPLKTISSALGANGERLLIGDVVWGKMHGFAWWPGKVLTLTHVESDTPQAQVAWYGSANSSLIKCDQLSLYLDNFKMRYNKKRKGPYKDAIRQAMTEARENAENRRRNPIVNSPVRNLIPAVPSTLASPREIDVAS